MISRPQRNLDSIWAAVCRLCDEHEVIQTQSRSITITKSGGNVMFEIGGSPVSGPTANVWLCDDNGVSKLYRIKAEEITPPA